MNPTFLPVQIILCYTEWMIIIQQCHSLVIKFVLLLLDSLLEYIGELALGMQVVYNQIIEWFSNVTYEGILFRFSISNNNSYVK